MGGWGLPLPNWSRLPGGKVWERNESSLFLYPLPLTAQGGCASTPQLQAGRAIISFLIIQRSGCEHVKFYWEGEGILFWGKVLMGCHQQVTVAGSVSCFPFFNIIILQIDRLLMWIFPEILELIGQSVQKLLCDRQRFHQIECTASQIQPKMYLKTCSTGFAYTNLWSPTEERLDW